MQRYFIKNEQHKNDQIIIDGLDYHHITHVMRMKVSDKMMVIDEDGNSYETSINSIDKHYVILNVLKTFKTNPELPINVTMAFGLTKYPKMEEVIRRITELGAFEFVGVEMERSNVRLDRLPLLKTERWELIVKEASEQSGRTKLMKITPFLSFSSLLQKFSSFDLCLFADEEKGKQNDLSLKTILNEFKGQSILVLIGPEGGISDKERTQLGNNHFQAVGLGPRILRCETAPLYVMSAISFSKEFGNEN
ncbi:MAG: 16S rRNA (uracil(1498)-N(3))-methyltransferase [Bacilli bacterium]